MSENQAGMTTAADSQMPTLYLGTRVLGKGTVVTANGEMLPWRLDLANHSSDGFDWGSSCRNDAAGNWSSTSLSQSQSRRPVDARPADRSSDGENTAARMLISKDRGIALIAGHNLKPSVSNDGKSDAANAKKNDGALKSGPSAIYSNKVSAEAAPNVDTPHAPQRSTFIINSAEKVENQGTSESQKSECIPKDSNCSAPTAISKRTIRVRGEAQLALALLAHHTGDRKRALALYHQFKWAVIAHLDRDRWAMTGDEIDRWLILAGQAVLHDRKHTRADR